MPTPHKPGMPALLSLLRGEPLPVDHDPATVLALAEAESILPWVAHLAPNLPGAAEATRQARINAFLYTSSLTALLKSFAAASIPVLLLKGPSFAERVYGDPALRPSRDLDLLVQPTDFARAQTLLLTLSFTPNDQPDDYHQSFSRNTVTVELHYNVENPLAFDFALPSAWQSAQRTLFHGQPALLFAPSDELLYLCLHGTRHRFNRLSYLLDIALASSTLAANTPLRPEAAPLANILALGRELALKLLPHHPALSTPPTSLHIHALAERLWHQLLTTPEQALDWQTLHRFYEQLEPTPIRRLARRLRHLRILATRTVAADHAFASSLGLHRPWQAHLLRPLRLLKSRLQG